MLLSDFDVGRAELLKSMAAALLVGEVNHRHASMNTYLINPEDDTICDLKIAIRGALKKSEQELEFTSRHFQRQLLDLGFSILRFNSRKFRNLGVYGYFITNLSDLHVVFTPDGQEWPNLFAPQMQLDNLVVGQASRSEKVYSTFVRDQSLVRKAKNRSNGFCEKCNERTFMTQSGEWYLEVHHKKWLSEHGPDEINNMVALCPNCHAQEHFSLKRFYK